MEEAATALLELTNTNFDIEDANEEPEPSPVLHGTTSSTVTDVSGKQIVNLQTECQLLREEKLHLREGASDLNETSLKNDDSKVKFYTGFPTFSVLITPHLFLTT